MVKTAIQCEDLSGWMVGWICGCSEDHPEIELVVHAERDWTAEIVTSMLDEGGEL